MNKQLSSETISKFFNRGKPFFAVIFLQFGFAGMDIISKVAMNEGMSNYVLVVYRHAVATIAVAPFAVILDKSIWRSTPLRSPSKVISRGAHKPIWTHLTVKPKKNTRKVRPKMTLPIFTKILMLSLLEPVIDQNFYYIGLKYTTATFAAAMCNILPAITFIMAWILRLEKVKFRSTHSQAKVVGTLTTVGGAMLMTLLKGPFLKLPWTEGNNHHEVKTGGISLQHSIKGALMITTGCFSWACFMILQAITLKTYPAELSLTAWICLLGTAEGAVLALIMERGKSNVWSIAWDAKLLAAIYSGIFCSGLTYYIQGVIMKERGPVFVTAFSPLSMVIVAVLSSFLLAEQMFLGRLLGAVVIVLGLYLVVWGKSTDYKSSSPSSEEQTIPTKQLNEANNKQEDAYHGVITAKGSSEVHDKGTTTEV